MWFRRGPTAGLTAAVVAFVLAGILVISGIGNFLGGSTGEAKGGS
jgi:hypothetical protein